MICRVSRHSNANIWMGGDLNFPDIDWLSKSLKPSLNYPKCGTFQHKLMFEKFKVTVILFDFVASNYPVVWAVTKQNSNTRHLCSYYRDQDAVKQRFVMEKCY